MFMVAIYFLWTYPRNERILQTNFIKLGQKSSRGEPLWKWIRKIHCLAVYKITWPARFNSTGLDVETFVITVDGTDCETWEGQHELFPVDKQLYSKKFNGAGLKYEVAVANFSNRIVWVNGPFRGGKHDMTIFREDGLKEKMLETGGKMVIADRGYRSSRPDEVNMMATPNESDPKGLGKFKSRGRCRMESLNSRLKQFKALTHVFRHGKQKHEWAFKAVAVIVQYQLENGAYLFEV